MLLLKGKNGKSVILEIISENTNNITMVYYDKPVIKDSLFMDSSRISFQDFMFELRQYISNLNKEEKLFDYLIIYTNQGEPTITHQKELFQKWENIYGFQIIVGCK